jgi:hypothetical protein
MGAASERSRSLEAAASAVAVEVVENPLWAESWMANVDRRGGCGWSLVDRYESCSTIVGLHTWNRSPLTVAELFGLADTCLIAK